MEFGIPAALDTPSGTLSFNTGLADDFRLSGFQITSPLRKSIDNLSGFSGAIVGPGERGGAFPSLQGQIVPSSLAMRATLLDRIRSWPDSIATVEGLLRWTPTGKTERRMAVTLMDDVVTRGEDVKEFLLALVAEDPRSYENVLNSTDSSVLASGVGGTWSIPFTFPINFGSASTGGVATIVNAGELPTPPILRIYGPITSPAVLNLTTSELISFPGLSIASGDYVEVDVAKRTARLNGSALVSVAGSIDFTQSSFWLLAKGSNSIRLAGSNAGAATHVQVLWRSAYR